MGDEAEFDKNPIKGRLNLAGLLVKARSEALALLEITRFASNSRGF
jgi:hypothetical protein